MIGKLYEVSMDIECTAETKKVHYFNISTSLEARELLNDLRDKLGAQNYGETIKKPLLLTDYMLRNFNLNMSIKLEDKLSAKENE
jgi:hypothetical protein